MCFSDFEYPEFYEAKIHKARKQHKCMECFRLIEVGEQYEHVAGKWGGEFETFKTCRVCLSLRNCIQRIEESHGCRGAEAVPPHRFLMEAAHEMAMFPTIRQESWY